MIRVLGFVLALASASLPASAGTSAFLEVTTHYEAIRLALLADSMTGVAERASRIERAAADLEAHFGAERAGVPAAAAERVKPLVARTPAAAGKLAAAKDLEQARAAFGDLSEPLIGWRSVVAGTRPAVAYCPMVKKAWLQPLGEIGNPFHGQSMARCGEFIVK